MKILSNKTLEGETLSIDDVFLSDCILKQCTLLYSGGEFTSKDTQFQDCKFVLSGAAQRTANLLVSSGQLTPPDRSSALAGPVN